MSFEFVAATLSFSQYTQCQSYFIAEQAVFSMS